MSLKEAAQAFEHAALRRRVAMRYAIEFPSEAAKSKYLKEHPDADPSNHTVRKKEPKPKVDLSEAESAASASKSRFDDNKRTFERLKKLKDGKDFDRGYSEIYEAGEKAADAAEKAVKKYEGMLDSLRGRAKKEVQGMLDLLEQSVREWNGNKFDHVKEKDKRRQLPNTYGYAQKLESQLRALPEVLKGNYDVQIDDSWRE